MEGRRGGGPGASGHLFEKLSLNPYWILNLAPRKTPKIQSLSFIILIITQGKGPRVLESREGNSVLDNTSCEQQWRGAEEVGGLERGASSEDR